MRLGFFEHYLQSFVEGRALRDSLRSKATRSGIHRKLLWIASASCKECMRCCFALARHLHQLVVFTLGKTRVFFVAVGSFLLLGRLKTSQADR